MRRGWYDYHENRTDMMIIRMKLMMIRKWRIWGQIWWWWERVSFDDDNGTDKMMMRMWQWLMSGPGSSPASWAGAGAPEAALSPGPAGRSHEAVTEAGPSQSVRDQSQLCTELQLHHHWPHHPLITVISVTSPGSCVILVIPAARNVKRTVAASSW